MIAVTGMGAISAVGEGAAATWAAVAAGRSGIRRVTAFETSPFSGHLAGQVERTLGFDRCTELALLAAREAWQHARPDVDPARVAVVIGTSAGSHGSELLTDDTEPLAATRLKRGSRHGLQALEVARSLGLTGPKLTVSTACASGNGAIALGADLLRHGLADVALVGGCDGLSLHRCAGFHALGVVSASPCAPFSTPVGMNLGEGAAFLVLERSDRGLAWMRGWGASSDAHHATAVEPSGDGLARALRAALADSGVERVDYVNAHATGTESNDAAEWAAVSEVLGDVPISGSKGFFGHTFGAAGALEAVLCVHALRDQVAPPTLHFRGPRPGCPDDPIPNVARPLPMQVVASSNAAFGGANAVVVFGREPWSRPLRRRDVYVHRCGTASDPDELRQLRRVDPRELDPIGALVTVAAWRALGERGDRDREGLIVGASRRPGKSSAAFRRSVWRRGPAGASAAAFSRTVMNAAAGGASRVLGLRGPTTTLAIGPGAGLFAIAWAALMLSDRDDADTLVAGGADELDADELQWDPELPEVEAGDVRYAGGAAFASLSRAPGPVRIGGVGIAGDVQAAAAMALGDAVPARVYSSAARTPEAVPWPLVPAGAGYGEAFTSAAAFVRAVAECDATVLVVCAHEDVGACAIRLEPGEWPSAE